MLPMGGEKAADFLSASSANGVTDQQDIFLVRIFFEGVLTIFDDVRFDLSGPYDRFNIAV
jgi:hypothetical protein